MPNSTIQFDNLDDGDIIFSPFTLKMEYSLQGTQAATLTVSDTGGASIVTASQLVLPTNGTLTPISVTLTYTLPPQITGESVSAMLTDANLNVLSSTSADSITVSSQAVATTTPVPVAITSPPGGVAAAVPTHRIATTANLTGTYNTQPPINGAGVTLIVQRRRAGKARKQIIYIDDATLGAAVAGAPAGTMTWTHAPIAGTLAGDLLTVLVWDNTEKVQGTTRAVFQ